MGQGKKARVKQPIEKGPKRGGAAMRTDAGRLRGRRRDDGDFVLGGGRVWFAGDRGKKIKRA